MHIENGLQRLIKKKAIENMSKMRKFVKIRLKQ